MNAARTVSAILSSPWLIDPGYVKNNLVLIESVLNGQFVGFDREDEEEAENRALNEPLEISGANLINISYGYFSNQRINEAPEGSIARISIEHPITRHNNCGDIGSLELARQIEKIDAADNFVGLILDINSPGGMVSGTQVVANAIKAFSKPVVSYINDGIAASAAYWIASQTDEIYVSTKSSAVGSIGVYVTLMDVKGWYEEKGIKIHEIYSTLSTEKNKTYRDALEGEYAGIQEDLDHIAHLFIDAVKSSRKISGDPFKGAMYYADEALQMGMIDGYGNLSDVVARVQKLSTTTFYV